MIIKIRKLYKQQILHSPLNHLVFFIAYNLSFTLSFVFKAGFTYLTIEKLLLH